MFGADDLQYEITRDILYALYVKRTKTTVYNIPFVRPRLLKILLSVGNTRQYFLR